jgi:DNA-directed RNA polymerase specialized sigma24 family protein
VLYLVLSRLVVAECLRIRAKITLRSIDDPLGFVRKALADELRSCGGTLRPVVQDDVVAYLLEVLVRLARIYDPSSTSISFSTYAYPIVRKRFTDFLRQHRGDSRVVGTPRKLRERDLVSIDASPPTEQSAFSEDDLDYGALINSIDHEKLSARARGALKAIARIKAEEGLSVAAAGRRLAKSGREARGDLERLRAELGYA